MDFVLHAGPNQGEHRPAMVVSVQGMAVNLQVFSDGTHKHGDCLNNTFWRHGVRHDAEGKQPDTWKWPRQDTKPGYMLESSVRPADAISTVHVSQVESYVGLENTR